MAHLSIEYSPSFDARGDIASVCKALHGAMIETGIFPLAGIRIRAYRAEYAIIADDDPANAFMALTLSVGSGRSNEMLKSAGDAIFRTAQRAMAELLSTPHFALSLEIRIIDPELSWKDTPIHGRLTARTEDKK